MATRYLLVDAQGRVPTHAHARGTVRYLHTPAQDQASQAYQVTTELWVQRVADLRPYTDTANRVADPLVQRAIGLLGYRERTTFHPGSGEALHFADQPMAVGRTPAQHEVFPRIDPAVIGRITLRAERQHPPKLLLAQNRLRPGYYSLIAGFVELGESIEQAFIREALEETGRRVENVQYVRSQPWPYGGSLMLGVDATTADEVPIAPTDEELMDIRWVTPEDIRTRTITLPGRSSIAYTMITEWAQTASTAKTASTANTAITEEPGQ
ncbi:NAD(+) diphosphatase [Corynebacterium kozikiae]|uniref:NAD(+) diphosphatase n=1 Tax=Corynebacterium kozikiae TaxID=2968469 RepID=UPI00211CE4BF|nr:NAD(+) diphosphatase [Corynebacterium sp. 76QC2CO]MCQ9343077.1 NUDIX domain-containing protein [Corynebacterium sp. 76QC2CO]